MNAARRDRVQETADGHLVGDAFLPARFWEVDIPHKIALMLVDGYDIHTMHQLLPHKDVRTTMISAHVLKRGPAEVRSPVDGL